MNGDKIACPNCGSKNVIRRGFNLSRAVRDTINDYINKQTGDDIVKLSLKKQSNLYTIIDNMAEKIASRGEQLQPSRISKPLRKALGYVELPQVVLIYLAKKVVGVVGF